MNRSWKKYKFSEIAELRKESVAPNTIQQTYIGLEHIEQKNLRLNNIGNSLNVISGKYKFYSGDILYGKLRPYLRKIFNPKFEGVCSTDIFVIKNKKIVISDFLFYLIATEEFTNIANSGSSGTRMPRAEWKQIANSEWLIPENLDIQKNIVSILSSLDAKIKLNLQINKTLEDIAYNIFKEWFVNFKHSGPTLNWKKGNFGNITKSNNERIKIKSATVLSAVSSGHLVKSDDYFKKQVYSKEISKYIAVNQWDFAYNPSRINIGSIGINENSELGAVSPVYVVFTPKKNYHWFIKFSLSLENIKQNIIQLASGSVRQVLTYENFSKIPIIIPDEKSIMKFNNIWESFKIKIDALNAENKILGNIRDTLLPQLLTGKLQIK